MLTSKKRDQPEKIEHIHFDMVGFPYTNIENNQMRSYMYKGTYKKLSNRKSVAFDISFVISIFIALLYSIFNCVVIKSHPTNNSDRQEYT